jgi:hypothetical protein
MTYSFPVSKDSLEELDQPYDTRLRYIPYIKDGLIQEYSFGEWHTKHAQYSGEHTEMHNGRDNLDKAKSRSKLYSDKYFVLDYPELNYTKNLEIRNNIYDTYTHEYLGDYLRFIRDYHGINLMPLYNCFSNNSCHNLDLEIKISDKYTAKFNTKDKRYKIYAVPVKLFQKYTIAIDSGSDVEMCCGIYDTKLAEEHKDNGIFSSIPGATYQFYNCMSYTQPKLYTKLIGLTDFIGVGSESKLAQNEFRLKLFIKIPASCTSSITILEGDYCDFNDYLYLYCTNTAGNIDNNVKNILKQTYNIDTDSKDVTILNKKINNRAVINYEYEEGLATSIRKPTNLQLLMLNTHESYPFADRLMEYLIGNAITPIDTVEDNIKRVKKVMYLNINKISLEAQMNNRNLLGRDNILPDFEVDEIWSPEMENLLYDYMNKNKESSIYNHDILGYVDKDVEKSYTFKGNSTTEPETTASINIYPDWE